MKLEKSNMGIRNIIIISLLLGGSLLIYLMYRIGFTVTPNYAPEEDVYGIPYNIGFQFPAILGALGVVFLQSSFWAMMSCRRNRIFLALACGVWLFFAFVPFEIASSTKTYMWFELGEFGYELDVMMVGLYLKGIEFFMVIMFSLIGGWHWFFGTVIDGPTNHRFTFGINVFAGLLALTGTVCFILISMTNPWYIITCACVEVLVILIFMLLERYWALTDLDCTSVDKKVRR